MAKKNKLIASGAALAMAAVLALTGTFAWQSISQQALNEAQATVNPGARLHSDYNGENADVYVENFSAPGDGTAIYARVRLDEYMEIGEGAGLAYNDPDFTEQKKATSVVAGAEIDKEDTWRTHKPGDDTNPFAKYWDWDADGGFTVYMPTFNKNKDSLKADVNGTYRFVKDGKHDPYGDYTTHKLGDTLEGEATYDADTNDVEDDGVTTAKETHTAKLTETATVVTMQQWMSTDTANGGLSSKPGPYWVWDEDGWAYWAQAIQPGEATGLLLDGVTKKAALEDSWYYAIHAVGQFVTADDLGWQDTTGQRKGFYSEKTPGKVDISENAEKLLAKIGAIPQPEADSVEITMASGIAMVKGTAYTRQFSAVVKLGTEESVNQDVTWTVSGNTDTTGTKISDKGLLTVSAKERADVLTVTATHKDYSTGNLIAMKTIQLFDSTVDAINYLQPGSADTVKIDGIELHVLAKDAANNRALLLTKQVVGTGTYTNLYSCRYGSDATPSAAVNSWLNGKTILKNVAVETEINSQYISGGANNNNSYTSAPITAKAFILSDSDVTGIKGNYKEDPFTYNGERLPAPGGSWVAYNSTGAVSEWFVRQTMVTYNNAWFYAYWVDKSGSSGFASQSLGGSSKLNVTSGIRPALWVDLTKLG